MTYVYTNNGLDFVEQATTDSSFSSVLNTVAVGDGTAAPSETDTSLTNQLYEETDAASNITIERPAQAGVGEMRATITITGGTEVPAGSSITEFGLKADNGTLVYKEVRSSPIDLPSGVTKSIEIRFTTQDAGVSSEHVITDVGNEFIADRIIGATTDYMDIIAVGDGTGSVSTSDTTLESKLYESGDSNSDVTLSATSTVGEVRAEITVTAGSGEDVAGNSNISEFGILTDSKTLVLHEKRTAVELEANDTKTFKIPFSIIE